MQTYLHEELTERTPCHKPKQYRSYSESSPAARNMNLVATKNKEFRSSAESWYLNGSTRRMMDEMKEADDRWTMNCSRPQPVLWTRSRWNTSRNKDFTAEMFLEKNRMFNQDFWAWRERTRNATDAHSRRLSKSHAVYKKWHRQPQTQYRYTQYDFPKRYSAGSDNENGEGRDWILPSNF